MKLISGLGNPTRKYRLTRHNMGFLAIDRIARDLSIRLKRYDSLSSLIGERVVEGERVILQKPLTFMNLSGKAVGAVFNEEGLAAEELMVVCDDINLALGRMRVRRFGSSGGHNGLRSIIEALSTEDFNRLRIGIGAQDAGSRDLSEYVLEEFSEAESRRIDKIIDGASSAIRLYIAEGTESAMNAYNNTEIV